MKYLTKQSFYGRYQLQLSFHKWLGIRLPASTVRNEWKNFVKILDSQNPQLGFRNSTKKK